MQIFFLNSKSYRATQRVVVESMDVELWIRKNGVPEGRLHMWVFNHVELVFLTPIVQRSTVNMCKETLSVGPGIHLRY